MEIKARERRAILQSVAAGVVPRLGLHHIQVGRKNELASMLADLKSVEDGGSAIKFVIGRYGSGKSFFLNLTRHVALERKFIVMQGDITVDRRLYGSGGHAKALYTELVNNMSTRARPEGGAMPGLVERFVGDVYAELDAAGGSPALELAVRRKLEPLLDLTCGSSFVRVLTRYVEGFATQNDGLINSATRWLRGEYGTKTEAREDLQVRDIIEDRHLYDMLKVWGVFVRIAGYRGIWANLDECVVISERLNNAPARTKNYEVILQILNDCLQGNVEALGFCFAGTEEFLSDRRRGLFSYEALATRLADNPFATANTVNTRGPVLRLPSLTQEEVFVMLQRIARVHQEEATRQPGLGRDEIVRFMSACANRLGADYFMTPRDVAQQFVGLLNILEENPSKTFDDLLPTASRGTGEHGKQGGSDRPDDELASFQL